MEMRDSAQTVKAAGNNGNEGFCPDGESSRFRR